MSTPLILLLIGALFYLLGRFAGVVVSRVLRLGTHLGVHITFLGILLGVLTSLPEISIGIVALITDFPSVSVGNLLGGIPVLVGLVAGASAVARREITIDLPGRTVLMIGAVLLLPFLLGFDGRFGMVDAVLMLIAYLWLLVRIFYLNGLKRSHPTLRVILTDHQVARDAAVVLAAVIGIMVTSSVIVRLTIDLLYATGLSSFLVGLLAYSVGTNLPEIIVAVTAWRRKATGLSVSNIMGSAMANVLILSGLAGVRTIPSGRLDMMAVAAGIAVIVAFAFFARSGGKIRRSEGLVLLALYGLFVLAGFRNA